MRIAPPRVSGHAAPAPRPPAGSPESDAYRQTAFLLGIEVEAVLAALALEGATAEASAAAKYRKPATAVALAFWSQSWLARLEALQATQWGRYVPATLLVRSAADAQAAMQAVAEGSDETVLTWASRGIALRTDLHAYEFRLEPARSGEQLARDATLGSVYREATVFAIPSYAGVLLLEGGDSNAERLVVSFGDTTFHLGLAELTLGWLLRLCEWQLAAIDRSGRFAAVPRERAANVDSAIRAALARDDRCRMERVEVEGIERWVVHNWRRQPGTPAKRFLL